jgi:hypothetical protein
MATVIDKLMIELGIDAKGFKSGMDDSLKTLKTAETVTDRTNKKSKKHQKEQGKVTKDHIKDLKSENKELGSIGKTLGTIGKGFVAYQALSKSFSAFKEITDESSKIERFSKSLNLSASQTQAFSNILGNIGGNGQEAINTIAGLQDKLNALQFEGDTSGARGLSVLGISPVALDGTRKSANQLLNDIRDGLKAVDDPNRRNWIAQQLGIGPDMLYAMSKSDEEWKKLNDNAVKQAQILDELGPKAQKFTEAWSTFYNDMKTGGLEIVNKALSSDIGQGITYGLEHGVEELKLAKDQFVKENSGTINAIGSSINKAADWVSDKASSAKDSAMSFFQSKGWTKEQAAGITANLQAESGLKTGAVGDSGKAKGIAQWHPDRQKKFSEVMGKDISESTLEDQLGFVDWELKNTEKKAGDALRQTLTAAQAGETFTRKYERPLNVDKDAALRAEAAKNIYANSISQPLSQSGQSQSPASATTISVDKVTINTQATDAKAIKQEFSGKMTAQADAGMM